MIRARICKRLRSPGIDSALQAGNRFLGSLKVLQIRALDLLLHVQWSQLPPWKAPVPESKVLLRELKPSLKWG